VPGLEMLVHQAGAQVRSWTGRAPDLEVMRQAGERESARSG
jgi:shikimate 5-dehydrogenase